MTNFSVSSLLNLPDEILLKIFRREEILIKDIYELQRTCLRLYDICQDDYVWSSKFKQRWKSSYSVFCDLMINKSWKKEYYQRLHLENEIEDYTLSLGPYFIEVDDMDDYHKNEIRSMCNNNFKIIYYYYESVDILKCKPSFAEGTYSATFLILIEEFLRHELARFLLKDLYTKPEQQSYKEAFYIFNCCVLGFLQYSPKAFEEKLNRLINYYVLALENRYQYSIDWNDKKSDFWKKDNWTIFEIENILKTLLLILMENVKYSSEKNIDHGCIEFVMQQNIGVKHCIIVLYTCICNKLEITITPLNDFEAVYYLTEEQASIIGFPVLIIKFNATAGIKRSTRKINRKNISFKDYLIKFIRDLISKSYFYDQDQHDLEVLYYELLYFLNPNDEEIAHDYVFSIEMNGINCSDLYKIYTTMNYNLSEEQLEECKQQMIEGNSGNRKKYPIKRREGEAVFLKYAVGCTYKDTELDRFYLVLGWRTPDNEYIYQPYYIVLASDKSFRKIKEKNMRPTIKNAKFDQKIIDQYFTGIENGCYILNEHLLKEYPDEEPYRIEHIKTVQFLKDFCLE